MKDQDRYFQKILGAYKVAPADETNIQKTVLAGKQLLMKNPVQELRWYRRIINQFKYISPLLWFSQLLAIGICMLLISQISSDTDMTAILSAISFIVALLGVVGFPEVCKSFSYQMWELEQSCKYNLRQIVAIKLSIIGTIDLIIILAITLFTSLQTELPMWEMALYLFVPFNLACIISFFITSLARNKNSVFPIFPAGFGFAFLMLLCINRFSPYQSISIPIWLILCFGTFAILIWKAAQFIKGMDEGGLAICN